MNKKQKLQNIIEYDGDTEVTVDRMTNTMYRVGYCSQCGSCCKCIDIQVRVSPNVIHWLDGYGVKVKKLNPVYEASEIEEESKDYAALISIPITCIHLIQKDNFCTCGRYEERPSLCKLYPRNPSKWPTCTYVFVNEDELNWFLKEHTEYWSQKDGKTKEIRIQPR